ncbi:Gfo/Idh/MocA family protein [Pleomorphomonas carboxyditropha]|uniref:Inositol 2-dehydrogenase n=1 Tax=Pleomorphomonas carboxyditropha TaxID=2023338 RepID=A0A2G9WTA1_9HYPH|nr:Gfo/Idh/MocA family oxidoreductase [Pleomorphomonas carboxyditropha]PIO97904.1 inositol 2-dehydrogenase [Pleomorphomonas carboxyditropha]
MTLKVGVIGTGAIGQEHINRLNNKLAGAQVVAASDIDAAAARAAVAKLAPGAKVHADGRAVIADPNVDAVVVTSWGPTHEEFVLAAIAAGKPVFCEKPLATTADACLKIVNAEIAAGRHLVQVGFMRRYDSGYRALKKAIDDGAIGAPLMVHCAHRNPSVPEAYVSSMAIVDTFIHEIDVLRWLIGDDYASAQVIVPRNTRLTHSKLDDPIIVMLATKGGIRIDGEVFVNCQYGYDIRCQVVGEDGVADLPEPQSVPLRREGRFSTAILQDWKLRFIDSYDVELQDWIDATKLGKVDGPNAWDGYFAAVTADACLEAQRTGAVVPIVTTPRPVFYDKG